MLFKAGILDGIQSGSVTLAFRRWSKPSVHSGSTMRTAIGVIEVTAVTEVKPAAISDHDAHNAGFASRDESLEVGYRLSSRGRAAMNHLKRIVR